jgi:MFS family permease
VVAVSPDWLVIIAASFFLGAGAGAIDTSFNIFASVRFSPAVINWLHAFYGVGATAGPVLLTWLFTNRRSWESGYLMVASVQMMLAVLFFSLPDCGAGLLRNTNRLKLYHGERPSGCRWYGQVFLSSSFIPDLKAVWGNGLCGTAQKP